MSRLGLVGLVLLVACATPPAPEAYLRVDVAIGAAPARPEEPDPAVHLLLDLSSSLSASEAAMARALAARILQDVAPESSASVSVLGLASGPPAACTPAIPIGGPNDHALDLAELVTGLGGVTESSLARELGRLERRGADLAGTRVVVVGDLGDQCAAPRAACAQASALVAAGVELELLLVGDRPIASCWTGLLPRQSPVDVAAPPPGAAPRVRVGWRESRVRAPGIAAGIGALEREAEIPARERIALPAGPVRITIDLDPPEIVGPLLLPPGVETRVRILDFPSLSPPVREVFVDTIGPDVRTADDLEQPG